MTDVTRILSAIDQGDAQAAEQLLTLVYDELRRLAAQRLSHEKPGQILQATVRHLCTRRIKHRSELVQEHEKAARQQTKSD